MVETSMGTFKTHLHLLEWWGISSGRNVLDLLWKFLVFRSNSLMLGVTEITVMKDVLLRPIICDVGTISLSRTEVLLQPVFFWSDFPRPFSGDGVKTEDIKRVHVDKPPCFKHRCGIHVFVDLYVENSKGLRRHACPLDFLSFFPSFTSYYTYTIKYEFLYTK